MNTDSRWSGTILRRFHTVPWAAVWSLVALLLTALLVWRTRGVVGQALPYLRAANYRILIAAGVAEIGFFYLLGYANQWLYRMYGRRPSLHHLAAMVSQATMINEVLPASGLSGSTGFVFWGNRLSLGLRDTIAVSVWFMALGYAALVPLVAVCVAALTVLRGTPSHVVQATLWTALAYVASAAALGVWSWRKSAVQSAGAAQPPSAAHRPEGGAASRLRIATSRRAGATLQKLRAELSREWRSARGNLGRLAVCTLILLGIYAVRIVMLRLCFTSLGVQLHWRTAVFAYALTQLFATISLSPTTLGVVDVAYATTLSWFGVALPEAIAGTVLYRIATFWWPIPLGLFSQWWLTRLARRRQEP